MSPKASLLTSGIQTSNVPASDGNPAQDGKIQEMFGFPIEKETVQGENMKADFTLNNGKRVGFSNTAIVSQIS